MSDDLVKRLRDPEFGTETTERNLMNSAADRIEELEAERDALVHHRIRIAEAALNRMLAEARAKGMEEALEDVYEADSLELAKHSQSKIVERVLARAAAVREGGA